MPFTLGRRPRFLRGRYIARPIEAPVIHTARLLLRPHRLADAEAWYRLQSDPAVVMHLPWPLRDRRQSRRHLRARTRHTRLAQSNDFLALAVELDGQLIGDVSLHLRTVNKESRTAEISWIIDPNFGGRGYATEAARAMLDLAFDRLGAKLIVATVDLRNKPSLALSDRLRFVPAGQEGKVAALVVTAHQHTRSLPTVAPTAATTD